MIHKKVSINPISPNCANIKSPPPPSKHSVEMKTKGCSVAITWLSFAESLPSRCANFNDFCHSHQIQLCQPIAQPPFTFQSLTFRSWPGELRSRYWGGGPEVRLMVPKQSQCWPSSWWFSADQGVLTHSWSPPEASSAPGLGQMLNQVSVGAAEMAR